MLVCNDRGLSFARFRLIKVEISIDIANQSEAKQRINALIAMPWDGKDPFI